MYLKSLFVYLVDLSSFLVFLSDKRISTSLRARLCVVCYLLHLIVNVFSDQFVSLSSFVKLAICRFGLVHISLSVILFTRFCGFSTFFYFCLLFCLIRGSFRSPILQVNTVPMSLCCYFRLSTNPYMEIAFFP